MPQKHLVHLGSAAGSSHAGLRRSWRNAGVAGLLLASITACTLSSPPLSQSGTIAQSTGLSTEAAPTLIPLATGEPAGRAPTLGGGTSGATVELDDGAWSGGYRPANGATYGGRTVTSIYGTATQYSSMRASFVVETEPFGTAELRIEGMDSEGEDKAPIVITINNQEIYSGPNLLPDDDPRLKSGTWDSYTWTFNAQLLRPGANTITIANAAVGAFSRPPFLMLDYAELIYEAQ